MDASCDGDKNLSLIQTQFFVEAKDNKKDDWYKFGGTFDSLLQASNYMTGNVLYKSRRRRARIVEITTYRRIVEPQQATAKELIAQKYGLTAT